MEVIYTYSHIKNDLFSILTQPENELTMNFVLITLYKAKSVSVLPENSLIIVYLVDYLTLENTFGTSILLTVEFLT